MRYLECFDFLAQRRKDQMVVTSAGNSAQAWWRATRDSQESFYLEASMSLSSMFAAGLAIAQPDISFWAFVGDGAFCMNPGMVMVERQLNLANLTHFLVSNRVYGATSNAGLPNYRHNDYAAIVRGMGVERVFAFDSLSELERGFDRAVPGTPVGHTVVILEVEPFSDEEQRLEQPPFDGAELKYLFGRRLEKRTGANVFGYTY